MSPFFVIFFNNTNSIWFFLYLYIREIHYALYRKGTREYIGSKYKQ
jgi:hypothetical protein